MAKTSRPSAPHKISLRPEARPFRRASLTESQKQIFEKVVSLLRDALKQLDRNQLDTASVAGFPARLHPQSRRINPVIMVTGGRGTGKTSLLLTLQHEVIVPTESTADPLSDLRRRIIWLETLDLEPMPQSTGLMAAIMARIEQAVNEDAQDDESILRRPRSDFGRAIQDLNDLSLDVCLAWDQEYPRLGGSTDTDLHSRELMRVEKARTNLQARFARLLDDLASNTLWKSEKEKPLFVLPVDDIDLNPSRCLELLRLVRSIRTPRFVVLLFGDFEVARFVVNLSYLKEFGELLPDRIPGTDRVLTSIDAQSYRLGAEAIRKMLPPNQRFEIESVSVKEALEFIPEEEGAESIEELLEKIKMPYRWTSSRNPLSLKDWIEGHQLWPPGKLPSAGLAFTLTLRKLTDLWIRLTELTGVANQAEWLEEFIATLWVEFQRGLVEDGIVTGPDAQREVEYEPAATLPHAPFHLEVAGGREIVRELPSPRASRLNLRFPAQLRFVGSTSPQMIDAFPSHQTLGRAVLLHDLMVLTRSPAPQAVDITQDDERPLVMVVWQVEVGGTVCSATWPAPPLAIAWELELFLAYWARFQSRFPGAMTSSLSQEDLIPVATYWLALCGAFAFRSEKLWKIVGRMITSEDVPVAEVVEGYAGQLPTPGRSKRRAVAGERATRGNGPPPSPDRSTEWLLRTAAFLSPECFIDPSIARAFQSDPEIKDYWSGPLIKGVVREYRKRTVTNPNALIARALMNGDDYAGAVSTLLERCKEEAEDLVEGVSAETFRLRDNPKSIGVNLVSFISESISMVSGDAWNPDPDDAFSKQLAGARVSLNNLRLLSNQRTMAGNDVRNHLDVIENRLRAIEVTLSVWINARTHPANTFNNGEFCPVLLRDEVVP